MKKFSLECRKVKTNTSSNEEGVHWPSRQGCIGVVAKWAAGSDELETEDQHEEGQVMAHIRIMIMIY